MTGKKRVLVVDDEPKILRLFALNLQMAGYEVVTSGNGEEALRLVETDVPDVVLLDIVMSPLSGFDVMKRLRSFSRVPVIVVTARNFIEEEALKIDADAFLAKPFRSEELIAVVKEVLAKKNSGGAEPA